MINNDLLPSLIAERFRLYGEAQLGRTQAARLIATHGESVRSDYFSDPQKPLVTVRPIRSLEVVR